MKCSPDEALRFIERPDLSLSGALIFGEDPVLVSEHKRRLLRSVLGDRAGDDLYLLTLDPGVAQRDEEAVHAVLTSRSLLPGRQVALLDSATNAHTKSVARALEDPDPEDAFLIVAAGDLKFQSTLRKLFDAARTAISLPAEVKQPTAQDLRRRFQESGMPAPSRDAVDRMASLSREITWGEFESLFDKLALYMHGKTDETSVADVDACAPLDRTVQLDELVDAVATGDRSKIALLLRALVDMGTTPVSIVILTTLQFLQMHRAVAMSHGTRGIRSAFYRQPMHPARRQVLESHCMHWSAALLEAALQEFHNADLALRASNTPAPLAVLERALMRVAGMAPRAARQRSSPRSSGSR